MRKLFGVLASMAVLLGATSSFAEDWKLACDPIEVWSRYVLPIGIRLSDEPIIQGSCYVTRGSLTAGMFLSQSLRSPGTTMGHGTFGNEADYFLAWAGNLSKNLALDAGVQYFDFVDLFKGPSGDALNTYGKITYKGFATWEPYLRVDTFTGLGHEKIPSGWYAQLGAKTTLAGFSFDGSVLRNQGVNDLRVSLLRLEVASIDHCLKGSSGSVCPVARVTAPFSGPQKTEVTFGVRIAF